MNARQMNMSAPQGAPAPAAPAETTKAQAEQPATSTAIAPAAAAAPLAPVQDDPLARLAGTFAQPGNITHRLAYAARECHLVSPAAACGAIPDGCAVAFSVVWIDQARDTYNVSGKCGLSKHALLEIANAAGIAWDARASGRLDDGRDPLPLLCDSRTPSP